MPKTIFVNNTDLTRDKRHTYLSEDVVATGSTIRVQSIIGFASLTTSSGQIICIGEIGNEKSEILRTDMNTALSTTYNQIPLRDSLRFDHPQDTKVYIIDWNRVEAQWAATVTGTKSTLFANPFQVFADRLETDIKDSSQTSGYYFTRFNESINNGNSDWGDPTPYGGFDDNTVFMIKKRALDELGEEVDGKLITHEFLNQCLWQARREYHNSVGKRPFRRKFNVNIGNALTGSYRIELPDDVDDPFSGQNVYGVRIGSNQNMTYYDKKDWDYDFVNKPHTFLTTAYAVGDQDLYCSNVRDFTDSGAVSVEGTNISYSARGVSGGTLRISSAGSWAASIGSDVWQNAVYGLPDKFTVFADPGGSAYIYFNRVIDTSYVNLNIYSDYYGALLGYDSDADILDEPSYDMFVHYLKAKIKHRRTKGESDILQDSDYKLWLNDLSETLKAEYIGTELRAIPGIEHLLNSEPN